MEEQVAQTRGADAEPSPINSNRLGPAHATEAYAAARREREEARARQKRAAAAERVTVIRHEPAPVEADRPPESTLLGTDGRPLDAAQAGAGAARIDGLPHIVAGPAKGSAAAPMDRPLL